MGWYDKEYVDVNVLLGKTLTKIDESGSSLKFYTDEGEQYLMYHEQCCCESVDIEDISGDLEDLIGSPLTMAEEVSSDELDDDYEDREEEEDEDTYYQESETWTYYKLATVKGYVTIRWYGTSNGYYSESVDFVKLDTKGENN